jgi:hypothetical protein
MNNQKVVLLSLLFFCFSLTPIFAEWEGDYRLTDDPGESYTFYDNARNTWNVAAHGDTVHVVWCDDFEDPVWHYEEVYYRRSLDGGQTWGDVIQLSFSPYTIKSELPTIAVSGSNIHIAWSTYVGNWANDIFYRRSTDAGETWQDTVRLTYSPDSMRFISSSATIGVKGNNVYVVYTRHSAPLLDGGNAEMICYRRSTNNGVAWGPEVHLTNGIDAANSPSVAVSHFMPTPDFGPIQENPEPSIEKQNVFNPGYKAHIVWSDGRDGSYNEIYYQCVSSWTGDVWSCKRLTFTDCASWQPAVAVSGSKVHVVWEEHTHTVGNKIFYKRSTNGGRTWGPDISLIDMGEYSNALNPSIAVSGSNVHVVWENFQNGCWLYYKRSTNHGSSWEPETCLTIDGYYWSRFASVAVSGPRVHMVWTDYRDGNCEIYYKCNPTGNPLNPGSAPANETQGTGIGTVIEQLHIVPNPFVSYARIPGCENDDFLLYDITGRHLGIYQGNRIGADLAPGVYFLKGVSDYSSPIRIVKLK